MKSIVIDKNMLYQANTAFIDKFASHYRIVLPDVLGLQIATKKQERREFLHGVGDIKAVNPGLIHWFFEYERIFRIAAPPIPYWMPVISMREWMADLLRVRSSLSAKDMERLRSPARVPESYQRALDNYWKIPERETRAMRSEYQESEDMPAVFRKHYPEERELDEIREHQLSEQEEIALNPQSLHFYTHRLLIYYLLADLVRGTRARTGWKLAGDHWDRYYVLWAALTDGIATADDRAREAALAVFPSKLVFRSFEDGVLLAGETPA